MHEVSDILEKIFEGHPKDFNILLWDGHLIEWSARPKFTLVFRDKSAFKKMALTRDAFVVGKAFVENTFDVEGDIFEALKLRDHLAKFRPKGLEKLLILLKAISL
jgi:cyclopropane-fatty-acyl-phospholipid synthase